MPVDCNIHYTSPDEGINALITRLSSDLKEDPLHTYLIAPTKQLARTIQESLDQENIGYVPDQITTITDFCKDYAQHNIADLYVIEDVEAMAILGMLFDTHKNSFPLLRAYRKSSYIRELFRFFGKITEYAVPFPECFHGHNSEKIKELGKLYELYHNYLRKQQYVDEYLLIDSTRKDIIDKRKELGTFYFFGLYDLELSVFERDLIRVLCDHAKKVDCTIPYGLDAAIFNTHEFPSYLLDRQDSTSDRNIGENGDFTNIFAQEQTKIRSQVPIYSTIYIREENGQKKKEYIDHCATKTEEITLIAKEITKLCAEEDLYDDITVAFPDVKDVLQFVDMVFEEYGIPFYTSQKYRFFSHPLSEFYMKILILIEQGLSYDNLFPVVMSPYFRYQKLSGRNLDLLMRWDHLERIPDNIDVLREKIENEEEKNLPLQKETLLNTLSEYQNLEREIKALQGKKRAEEHAENIITFFKRIINQTHLYDGDDQTKRIYSRFKKYISDSATFMHAAEPNMPFEQYCKYTRHYLEQASFPGPADRSGVRILSLRELAYETCQYLFLAGLNEGAIPRLTDRHPFTTKKETNVLNILKPAELIKIEQYLFISALCAGKTAIYLSACNDESKNLIESSFFDQIIFNYNIKEWVPKDEVWSEMESDSSDLDLRIEIEQKYRTGTLRSQYDGIISESPCIEEYLSNRFGAEAYWSASKLEIYAHCPFRFWIEKILRVKPLEDPTQQISFTAHGTLVHEILYNLYETLKERELLRLTSAHENDVISMLGDNKIKSKLSEEGVWLPEAKAQIGTLTGNDYIGEGSLKRFIRSEIKHQEEISLLMPRAFEFEFGKDVNAIVNLADVDDEQDQMLLTGKIDRIDHIGDQYFGIVDYKTGNTVSSLKDITSGLSLQIPLYMHAYKLLSGRMGVYGSYIQFKRNDVKITSPLYERTAEAYIPYLSPRQKELPSPLDEIIQNTVIQTKKHIRDIRKGYFPITARSECPDEWCPYRSICRYNINRGTESGEYTLYCETENGGGEHVNA